MTGFKKATRQHIHLKLAITGPSGSGKTYSALQLALGLGKRIALVDTENSSASLYCEIGDFDTLELGAPFTIQKYEDAIKQAVNANYDVLIIDSLSHAWAGDGGLLAQKESMDARGGNSYTNWGAITKQHERLKAAILQAPIHTIVTMRSKQDYVLVQRDGKQVPQKVGLAPVQRDGIEYEFTVVFDIAMNHEAQTSKDRTGLFDGNIAKLTPEHGKMLTAWLAGSQPAVESKVVQMEVGKTLAVSLLVEVLNIVDRPVNGEDFSFIICRNAVYQVAMLSESDRDFIGRAGDQIHVDATDTGRKVKNGDNGSLPLYIATWEIPKGLEVSNGQR